ncbi:MAG: diacylglycerol kinase family protein [Ruminococcaceae bacterium]|nr:diacylglycerol kinase family protein [Oscillospiraceae bacterium]
MKTAHVLYNPKAGNGKCGEDVKRLEGLVSDAIALHDVTQYGDDLGFLTELPEDDYIILCGGDGTLNRFVNSVEGLDIPNEILYCPGGSGNDFAHDLGKGKEDKPFSVKDYLKNLPTVTVNGKSYRFINGIGYGIDGYCCEEADKIRQRSNKRINYTAIALKGLIYDYKPTSARVTVDGKVYEYKKVWMSPTMHGRYFGGGMMATPNQDRTGKEGTVSLMVLHDCSNLRILMAFPGVYEGKHVKLKKIVDFYEGHNVSVEFSRPTALQIDGETVVGVTSYSVQTARARAEAEIADEEPAAVN